MTNFTNPAPTETSINAWSVFEAAPGKRVVFLPDAPQFTILAASTEMCRFLGLSKEQFVGKSVFDAFPDNPADSEATGVKNLLASLQYVLEEKREHQMERQRYDVAIANGAFEEIYWQNSSVPVLNENSEVTCIIHTAEDITEQVKAERRQEKTKGIEKAYHLFMQAPMVIGIAKGDDYVLELANEGVLKLWGKTTEIIGKPLLQSIPELKDQGILELFDTVRKTRQPYIGKELPVVSMADGNAQTHYYDVIYQPYYEEGIDGPVGVFTVSYDVTGQVTTRKKLEEKEQSLALAVEIGELGVFHVDLKTATGRYSPRIMEWFGLGESPLPMEEILSKIHPDDRPMVAETLELSIAGEWDGRHDFVYRVLHPHTGVTTYLRSIGQVQYENKTPVSISGIIQDETKQILSLKKIEESEERLRFALEGGQLGSWELDLTTMALEASAHCKRNFGQPLDKPFSYSTLQACIHPDDRHRQQEAVTETITTGKDYDIEYRVVWPDGSVHWVNIRGRVQKGDDGTPARMIGISLDTTAQVTARKQIEESEAKYRSLFENMDQGYCVIEMIFDESNQPTDYRFLEINPAFERFTGIENGVGRRMKEIAPLHEPHWFRIYGEIALTGIPRRFEERAEQLGHYYDVYAFRFGDDGTRKVAVLFADITERKKAEEALRESEQHLRKMILQAPVAICIFRGPEHTIEIANEKMFEFWGKPSEAVMHKPLFEALPEAKNQGYEELLRNVLETGQPFSANELPVTLPRAGIVQTVFINFSYEPLRETNGKVSGIMAIATDVTEQVMARQKIEDVVEQRTNELGLANEALVSINKELQRSNANLEEFAHAASHDLKEPIRKITFFTRQLKDQLGAHLKGQEVRSFGRIENATERMGELIDDLLLYSHVSQRPHETESVDLNLKVQRVLEDLELDIDEKRAVVQAEKLPAVQGYDRQLQQLFQNLISNALKYSKADVPPYIQISSHIAEENGKRYNLIKVEDNGIGFDRQYADKIFQMFARLHGKNEYGGTGVGLSIVKKVVENHNGFIRVESVVGEGSVFKIYFPV